MNINIKVININGSKKYTKKPFFENGELYIYCSGTRPLSNPFETIEEFERTLSIRGARLNRAFEATIKYIRKNKKSIGRIVLGCHYKPKKCHCDVLKRKMDERLKPLYFDVFMRRNGVKRVVTCRGVREENNIIIIVKGFGWIVADERGESRATFFKENVSHATDITEIKIKGA